MKVVASRPYLGAEERRMEKSGDQYEIETGEELLVAVATHEGGAFSLIGTFTEMRLALIGSDAYATEYDGESGKVVATEVYATCLNQHGTCPALAGGTLHPAAKGPEPRFGNDGPACSKEQVLACPTLWVGPTVMKEDFAAAPDYAVISGLVENVEFRGDVGTLVWDLFSIEGCTMGDHERAREITGLPVCVEEPEIDNDSEEENRGLDDHDAAIAFLRKGGTICKVPDSEGSPHFRLLVVDVEGGPERGNCE